ncbi:MAG TPA: ABC-ATPase domain-containing protein, partial [Leptolyngbyaceae cyanobacterium]
MKPQADLRQQLQQLEGRSYGAYKSIRGEYACGNFTLLIDQVQGDPFAAPSRVRVQVPQTVAQFPAHLYSNPVRATALADYLTRQFHQAAQRSQRRVGSGKSGLIAIAVPSQAILKRTAARVTADAVEVRFTVGLPAFGRRIAGQAAASLLCEEVPDLVMRLLYTHLDPEVIQQHVNTAEDADWLRRQLDQRGLVAFIADDAILPRRSGVDERPLAENAISFRSPESLRVTFDCPHANTLSGMGIPKGITLIVGGGYHGKSTLLQVIEAGVYAHVPGDGRERVITNSRAMKVRAEDGRSITGVNISPFINHLPQDRSTTAFSTSNANGS